ncbi:MAG TPA: 50S ribosomal protein L5, partial [Gemmatimonadaceae bacterium]|nr:50S ribosomal protein L5 [Gemmatimonadaceae bacterium]
MATEKTETKPDAKPEAKAEPKEQKQQKGGGKKKGGAADVVRPPHPGVGLPVPPARLRIYYEKSVRPKLQQQFKLENVHEIPKLTKIVINVGFGEAVKQGKLLDGIVNELETIAGQRPVRTRAKKSISNFGLRQGQEIGASVTLRGARMWE